MCVLTPYQFTCADPFGEHVCGSGYYFHVRTLCHRTPACTKFYTIPIMLSTSCGTCEQFTRCDSHLRNAATSAEDSELTSFSLGGSGKASLHDGHASVSDDTTTMSQGSGSTLGAPVEGVAL